MKNLRSWFRISRFTPLLAAALAACLTDAAVAYQVRIRRAGEPYPRPGELGQRLEISLDDSAAQVLPQEVSDATVGPDGRVWFQCARAFNRPYSNTLVTLPTIKEDIVAEFAQTSPQVRGCFLSLLEPGGRAWYWCPEHATLLGYDGKKWTELVVPAASENERPSCPTRGALANGRRSAYAGSAAWFVLGGSVYRFDGENWSKQRIATPAPAKAALRVAYSGRAIYRFAASDSVLLAVSPNGKVAAAAAPAGPIQLWRNGKWKTLETALQPKLETALRPADVRRDEPDPFAAPPGIVPPGREAITSLALQGDTTLWCLFNTGRLLRIALAAEPDSPPTDPKFDVQQAIKDLAANDFVVRERAEERLAAGGAAIAPQLQEALKSSTDAEQRTRLKRLIERLGKSPAEGGLQTVGRLRVGGVRSLGCDEEANVYLVAQTIDDGGGKQAPGLAILASDGTAKTVLLDPQSRLGLGMLRPDSDSIIRGDSGRSLWMANVDGQSSLSRFDLASGQIVNPSARLPLGGLRGIDGQGHIFVHGAAGAGGGPVMVLKAEQ